MNKFTTIDDLSLGERFEINIGVSRLGTVTISNMMILEGDYTNKIPLFFEDIKSSLDEGEFDVLSCGKNLFNKEKIIKNKNIYPLNGTLQNVRKSVVVKVKEETNYSLNLSDGHISFLSFFNDLNSSNGYGFISGVYDNYAKMFKTPKGCKYICVCIINENDLNTIQLEEGTVSTPYEPYKEDKISINLLDSLRGLPNGTCDEVDLEKGKLIKKILKQTVKREMFTYFGSVIEGDYFRIWCALKPAIFPGNIKGFMCDRFPYVSSSLGTYSGEGCTDTFERVSDRQLQFKLLSSKLQTIDIEGFFKWVEANPITVYYCLETPVETSLNLSNNLRTYDGITNISTQGSLIEPNVYCKIPSDVVTALDIEKDIKNIVTQEAWITPTLLNGWVKHDSEPKYFKDTLGLVRLKGNLKSGVLDTKAFILPVGYRPSNTARIPIVSDTYGRLTIASDGSIIIYSGSNIFSLDGISFRAEQ